MILITQRVFLIFFLWLPQALVFKSYPRELIPWLLACLLFPYFPYGQWHFGSASCLTWQPACASQQLLPDATGEQRLVGHTSWPACQEPLCFCLLITRCYWGVWAGQCAKSLCISHTKRNKLAAGSSRLQSCVPVLSGARPEPPTAISAVKSDAAAASSIKACCLTFPLAWSPHMSLVTQASLFFTGRGVRVTLCYITLY